MTTQIDFTKPVQTREGCPVRILTTEANNPEYPVVGLVTGEYGDETPESWTKDGFIYVGAPAGNYMNLVQAPNRTITYHNVYAPVVGPHPYLGEGCREPADAIDSARADFERIGLLKLTLEDGKPVSAEIAQ